MSVVSTEHRETLSPKVEAVPKNDRKRFQEIVEAHRGELLAHLLSIHWIAARRRGSCEGDISPGLARARR
jgi:hypothetical protein